MRESKAKQWRLIVCFFYLLAWPLFTITSYGSEDTGWYSGQEKEYNVGFVNLYVGVWAKRNNIFLTTYRWQWKFIIWRSFLKGWSSQITKTEAVQIVWVLYEQVLWYMRHKLQNKTICQVNQQKIHFSDTNRCKDVHFCSGALLAREIPAPCWVDSEPGGDKRKSGTVSKSACRSGQQGFSDFCQQDPFSFPSTNSLYIWPNELLRSILCQWHSNI